jgi:ParB family chromosome partitioning protein
LVVTRHEEQKEDGGIQTYYELIAGERRLRASKIAGLLQVPVVIRSNEESERSKLEMAIIENLQREDLNAIDRARAFQRLADEFKLNNAEIGRKIGKSREYVSNSMRLLSLPQEIQSALKGGAIYEGHARALLMLEGRPEEMMTVFRDITIRKLSVRDVEKAAREIAWEKARKRNIRPEIEALERSLAESLGTKVEIREQEGVSGGGKLIIDYFSAQDLETILANLAKKEKQISPPSNLPPTTSSDDMSIENFSI